MAEAQQDNTEQGHVEGGSSQVPSLRETAVMTYHRQKILGWHGKTDKNREMTEPR